LIVHSKGGTVTQGVFRLCSFALPYTDNYVYLPAPLRAAQAAGI